MMRTALTAVLLAGLSTVFFADTSYAQARCGSNGSFNNLESVGLTADSRLVCFREQGGGGVRNIGTITGLAAGESLVGIDFRPLNGMLYGISNLGTVYTLTGGNGTVTATALPALTNMVDGTPVLLTGASFGVDFNPVPDRLRVTSDTGQNLRINVDTGVTNVDGGINLAGVPVLGVTAAAYTNNDMNAQTGTVLNTLATGTATDQLNLQVPPNAGTQNLLATLSVAGTPVDSGADASFDIFSLTQTITVAGMPVSSSVAVRGLAVFTAAPATTSTLYAVNLASGALTVRRNFGANNVITGVAIPLLQGN